MEWVDLLYGALAGGGIVVIDKIVHWRTNKTTARAKACQEEEKVEKMHLENTEIVEERRSKVAKEVREHYDNLWQKRNELAEEEKLLFLERETALNTHLANLREDFGIFKKGYKKELARLTKVVATLEASVSEKKGEVNKLRYIIDKCHTCPLPPTINDCIVWSTKLDCQVKKNKKTQKQYQLG